MERVSAWPANGRDGNGQQVLRPSNRLVRQDYLWICRIAGRVVGTVGLRHAGPAAAQMCFFHVDPEWQHTSVPRKLIQCVRGHSADFCLARIVMEPRAAPRWLLRSLPRHGFQFVGCNAALGSRMLEFRVEPDI